MTAKEYENHIGCLLDVFFARTRENAAIRVRKGLKYRSETGYRNYSPIIDISVGPFSEERGVSLWESYDNLVSFSGNLIDVMLAAFRHNYQEFGEGYFTIEERTLPNNHHEFLTSSRSIRGSSNWNARCFIAIEVEDSGSRKHLLGDMINVSISGRIGIVVGYNPDLYETFFKQLDYLSYTVRAKKIQFNSRNIIVLKPKQLEDILIYNLPEADT